MNGTKWSTISNQILGSGFTYGEIMSFFKDADVESIFRIAAIQAGINGPTLWSVCIAGIIMNSFIVLFCLFMKWSSSSIMLEAISIVSVVKAVNLLFLHDIVLGNSTYTVSYIMVK